MLSYFCRRNGFVQQYFYPTLFNQDLGGLLTINKTGKVTEVVGGLCQDFFEFREVAMHSFKFIVTASVMYKQKCVWYQMHPATTMHYQQPLA